MRSALSALILLVCVVHLSPLSTAAQDGERVELVVQTGHASSVRSVAISPDGKLIASGGDDGTIKLWEIKSGKELKPLAGHTGSIYAVVFFSDGKMLASGGTDAIRLWDVASGRQSGVISLSAGKDMLKTIAVSPDGKTIVSGTEEGLVKAWDVITKREIMTFKNAPEHIGALAFHSEGKTISAVQSYAPKSIKFWELASGQELRTFTVSDETSYLVAVSPDAKIIARVEYHSLNSNQVESFIKLLDAATGRELKSVKGYGDEFTFSPDGKTFAWAMDNKFIKVWELASGREPKTFSGHNHNIRSITFSPDGKTLASGGDDKTVKLWNVESGLEYSSFSGIVDDIDVVAVSPDGNILTWWGDGSNIKLWNLKSGSDFKTTDRHVLFGYMDAATYSRDGRFIAADETARGLQLYDVASSKLKFRFEYDDPIRSMAFSYDGQILATGGDKTIKLWSITTGREIRTLSGHTDRVALMDFTPDDRMLVSKGWDETIKTWDVESGRNLKTLKTKAFIERFAISPDGGLIVFKAGNSIQTWDMSSEEAKTLAPYDKRIDAIAFSQDGERFVSLDAVETVTVWDLASGKELESLRADHPDTPSRIFAVAPDFYTNGRILSSSSVFRERVLSAVAQSGRLQIKAGRDGKLTFHEIKTGKLLASLIALGATDWVVTTPEGRFDTNKSLDRIDGLHWVVNDEILSPLPLDIFMRQYYEPRLLQRVLAGEQFKPLPSIADLNRVQPKVEIVGEPKPIVGEPGMVEVTLRVEKATGTQRRNGRLIKMETGVYDLRLFRDGQLVGYEPRQAGAYGEQAANLNKVLSDAEEEARWRRATKVKLDKDGRATRTFKVRLPGGPEAKQVELSAYAFNVDRVRSATAATVIDNPAAASSVKRRAYVITVGVNANENEAWDLSFAANDARRIERNMREQLVRAGQYAAEDIVTVPLIADYARAADGQKALPRRVTESYATKRNLQTVFELLAGKRVAPALIRQLPDYERLQSRLRQARPEDFVLISFSSHGYADAQGNFYLVPYDMGMGGGTDLAEQETLRRSISSAELSRWLRDVDAGELTMIVDACHAAASVQTAGFKPGPMASRGLGQLAYDKGMRILTSTQAGDKAWEADALSDISNAGGASRTGDANSSGGGNGLLTYVLTRDGLETFKADANLDGSVTLSEWLAYGVEGVPALAQALQKRIDDLNALQLKSIRLGDGTATRIIVLNRDKPGNTLASELQQLPSLFDFARKRRDPVIAVGN